MILQNMKKSGDDVERASADRSYMPAVDIFENEQSVTLFADMPGVDEKGVDIVLEKNILTIDGKIDVNEPDKLPVIQRDYGFGDFHRTFQLNDEFDVEKISANVKNGVLKIVLPRLVPTKRKITVNAG